MTILRLLPAILYFTALLSLFVFPWPMTLMLTVAAAWFYAPFGSGMGILADILYYPGIGVPIGTISGIVITLGMYSVRSFVKNRML